MACAGIEVKEMAYAPHSPYPPPPRPPPVVLGNSSTHNDAGRRGVNGRGAGKESRGTNIFHSYIQPLVADDGDCEGAEVLVATPPSPRHAPARLRPPSVLTKHHKDPNS